MAKVGTVFQIVPDGGNHFWIVISKEKKGLGLGGQFDWRQQMPGLALWNQCRRSSGHHQTQRNHLPVCQGICVRENWWVVCPRQLSPPVGWLLPGGCQKDCGRSKTGGRPDLEVSGLFEVILPGWMSSPNRRNTLAWWTRHSDRILLAWNI